LPSSLKQEIERMRSTYAFWFSVLIAISLAGCGKPAGTGSDAASGGSGAADKSAAVADGSGSSAAPRNMNSPEGAVYQFLAAIRGGDDRKTEAMFTNLARAKIAEMQYNVTPPGSDTARFEVGKVEYLADDGARVEATWSDLDNDGNRQTENMLWMVRREPEGWRIAGMAANVFPGEPPVLLDFENLQEALQKLQMLKEEIARRDQGDGHPDASEPVLAREDARPAGSPSGSPAIPSSHSPLAGHGQRGESQALPKVAGKTPADSANR
jgi:hypothetical protein